MNYTCPDCHMYLSSCCFHRYGKYDVYYCVGFPNEWVGFPNELIDIYPRERLSPLLLSIKKLTLLDEERIERLLLLK